MCEACAEIGRKMEMIERCWREVKIYSLASASFSGTTLNSRGWPHPFIGPASNEQLGYIAQLQNELAACGKRPSA